MNKTSNGIKVYRSMVGHNNFYYPNKDDIVFLKPGSNYTKMHWVGSNMAAINVNAQDIVDEAGNSDIVVWVEPDKLKTI
jgi:hypothetical protein